MNLPIAFEDRMRELLGEEYEEYLQCYSQPHYSGIRVNTLKISPEVGYSKPEIMRNVVVFPQPEGPSKVTSSPSVIFKSMFLTATNSPLPSICGKIFVTPDKRTPLLLPLNISFHSFHDDLPVHLNLTPYLYTLVLGASRVCTRKLMSTMAVRIITIIIMT